MNIRELFFRAGQKVRIEYDEISHLSGLERTDFLVPPKNFGVVHGVKPNRLFTSKAFLGMQPSIVPLGLACHSRRHAKERIVWVDRA